jgi:hypothetical protein
MDQNRSPAEELVFKIAELDAAMKEAGFELALNDPEAARDLSYRARYLRFRSTLYPRLQANLEYYLANRSYSLRIASDEGTDAKLYYFLVKNYKGSLRELLDGYFNAMRRGIPFMLGEGKF